MATLQCVDEGNIRRQQFQRQKIQEFQCLCIFFKFLGVRNALPRWNIGFCRLLLMIYDVQTYRACDYTDTLLFRPFSSIIFESVISRFFLTGKQTLGLVITIDFRRLRGI